MPATREVDAQRAERARRNAEQAAAAEAAAVEREAEEARQAALLLCPVCLTPMSPWLRENGYAEHIGCHPDAVAELAAAEEAQPLAELPWVVEQRAVGAEIRAGTYWTAERAAQVRWVTLVHDRADPFEKRPPARRHEHDTPGTPPPATATATGPRTRGSRARRGTGARRARAALVDARTAAAGDA